LNVSVIPLEGVGLNVNMPIVGVGLYVNASLVGVGLNVGLIVGFLVGGLVGDLVGDAASQSDSKQKMNTATSIAQTSRFIVLTITDLTADKQASRIYSSIKDTTMASAYLVVPFTRIFLFFGRKGNYLRKARKAGMVPALHVSSAGRVYT